jgi:16S rRNA (cytidine1402-2'-O)-methyltransferase
VDFRLKPHSGRLGATHFETLLHSVKRASAYAEVFFPGFHQLDHGVLVQNRQNSFSTSVERQSVDTNNDELDRTEGPQASEWLKVIAERTADVLTRELAKPLASGLYLVATPIGNLSDVTLRALAVLANSDTVYCEDTRHSRLLLDHFGIRTRLKPYHEHNAEAERPVILTALARGARIALISDAGTPLVSDPGYKLVREAAASGHAIISVPGASAVLTALTSSGLPTDTFLFAGFLPPKQAARRKRLLELADIPGTLIVFEAPQRVADTLADMAEVLGNRTICIARELTKLHEEVKRGLLEDFAGTLGDINKGEFVILVGPPLAGEVSDEALNSALSEAMKTMTLKDAAKTIANDYGVPKSRAYSLGLTLKSQANANDD